MSGRQVVVNVIRFYQPYLRLLYFLLCYYIALNLHTGLRVVCASPHPELECLSARCKFQSSLGFCCLAFETGSPWLPGLRLAVETRLALDSTVSHHRAQQLFFLHFYELFNLYFAYMRVCAPHAWLVPEVRRGTGITDGRLSSL